MPIARGNPLERLPLLREMAEAAGRDPASIEISVYGCPMRADDVERFRAAGADRVVFWLPAGEPDEVLAAVDHGAQFID